MRFKYEAINPRVPRMLHGGDYNPDQWLNHPEIFEEDIRLMKMAGCNCMSIGIFSWTALEPVEGEYRFEWMDKVMDRFAEEGIYAVLATPTGARPAWMSHKYPEVLRVTANRTRNLHGRRHNHCYTSPVYREKSRAVTSALAQRYKNHPALLVWHLSNEYGGECHCPLCQDAFRDWIKAKYETLEKLNEAWWMGFWSHLYTDWNQVESPSPIGEPGVHGLNLDWKRFVTHQTRDFMREEISTIRAITPNVPITTNFMGTYPGLDYWRMADDLDVVSWDNYPCWHQPDENGVMESDWRLASRIAFVHDITRSLKHGRPFMLMESTPSMTNWQPVAKLKRPGMHILSSLQAVAHGSDTVQYFQWRKSRGNSEKFHGAVVDHEGSENTRVFKEVSDLGSILKKLDPVVGTGVDARVAIMYDWNVLWAIDDAQGPRNDGRKAYLETCMKHYHQFWKRGIACDVVDSEQDLSLYSLVIAPMLYMVKSGVAESIGRFVKNGGTFCATYWSGIVDDTDLCFLGGFPGPLKDVLGIWAEEIDNLYPEETRSVILKEGNSLGLEGPYAAVEMCDLIHARGAEVLAEYDEDFYRGRAALTRNNFGQGRAYYIAARMKEPFLEDFYGKLIIDTHLPCATDGELPIGVSAQVRRDDNTEYLFLMNFAPESRTVEAGQRLYHDLIEDRSVTGPIVLGAYGVKILQRETD